MPKIPGSTAFEAKLPSNYRFNDPGLRRERLRVRKVEIDRKIKRLIRLMKRDGFDQSRFDQIKRLADESGRIASSHT